VRSSLTVGGIEVELRVPRGPIEPIVAERYGPFLGAVVDPVCSLRVASTGVEQGEPNPPLATVTGAATDLVGLQHPDFSASFALEGEGDLTVAENPFTIDHAFRVLFGLLAPRHDAVMLHSCGLISGGVANVFAGESGAGKSTLASMAGSRPLLSDEHVLVRKAGTEWVAASTPFWGSYAKPGPARQAPLERLWSLVQWPINQIRVTDSEATLRTALDNAVLPCADPGIKSAVFDVACRLAEDVPSAELRFALDESVWELIDARAAVA
jgi:hypothetical protein